MKSVFLSYCYPPLNVARAVQVGRLVKNIALRPLVVVCADASGSEASPDGLKEVTVERLPTSRLFESVRTASWITRLLRVTYRPFRAFTEIPDVYRSWANRAARHILARHSLGPNDLLVTFGQPMSDHLAGCAIKQAAGVRWIAHFSDPWVDNPFRRDGAWARRKNLQLERAVIESADCVIFTSAETQDLVMAKYPVGWKAKTRVIGHAFDRSLYPAPSRRDPAAPFIIRHLGSFYGARTPDCLYRPLEMLLERRPDLRGTFRVELIGERDFTASGRLPDVVSFHESVDYLTSLRLMVEADALLVIDAPADLSVFLPSKLVDYIGADRPIIAITPPGTSYNLVRRLGGQSIVPSEPEQVAAGFERLIDELRSNSFPHPTEENEIRDEFAAENVAQKMQTTIDEVMKAQL